MGFKFRKSVKLAPGVKLNFGKKGLGMSVGGKGARFSVSSSGRTTASFGIPGTGLSYSTSLGGKKKRTTKKTTTKTTASMTRKARKPASPLTKIFWGIFWLICCFAIAVYGIINIAQGGWFTAAFGLICCFFIIKYIRAQFAKIINKPNTNNEKKAGE